MGGRRRVAAVRACARRVCVFFWGGQRGKGACRVPTTKPCGARPPSKHSQACMRVQVQCLLGGTQLSQQPHAALHTRDPGAPAAPQSAGSISTSAASSSSVGCHTCRCVLWLHLTARASWGRPGRAPAMRREPISVRVWSDCAVYQAHAAYYCFLLTFGGSRPYGCARATGSRPQAGRNNRRRLW